MSKSQADRPSPTTWRARGLPPSIAREIERRDRIRSRAARLALMTSLVVTGAGSAIYFSGRYDPRAALVTAAIAGGERSFTRLAALVTSPATRIPVADALVPTPAVEPTVTSRVLSAASVSDTGAEVAPARRIMDAPAVQSAQPAAAPTVVAAVSPSDVAAQPTLMPSTPGSSEPQRGDAVGMALPGTAGAAPAPAQPWAPVVVAALPAGGSQPQSTQPISSPTAAPTPVALPAAPKVFPAACVEKVVGAARQTVVWFEIGSADVSVVQSALIGRLAEELVKCPAATLEIAGHADTVGVDNNNFALSWRRAEAVRSLLEAAGVAPGRLVPVGYGTREPMPVAKSATTKDVNQLNRRVEFKSR